VTAVIVPVRPVTVIADGYGVPTVGLSGILTAVAFVKVAVGDTSESPNEVPEEPVSNPPTGEAVDSTMVAASGLRDSESSIIKSKTAERNSEKKRRVVGILIFIGKLPLIQAPMRTLEL
jgi:hypothetical protein